MLRVDYETNAAPSKSTIENERQKIDEFFNSGVGNSRVPRDYLYPDEMPEKLPTINRGDKTYSVRTKYPEQQDKLSQTNVAQRVIDHTN